MKNNYIWGILITMAISTCNFMYSCKSETAKHEVDTKPKGTVKIDEIEKNEDYEKVERPENGELTF